MNKTPIGGNHNAVITSPTLNTSEADFYERETMFRAAMDAAQIGFWNWNLLTNTVTCSPQVEKLFCLKTSTAEKDYEVFRQQIYPADQKRIEFNKKKALASGKEYRVEYRVVWPDSSIHWLSARGRAIYDMSGRAVQITGVTWDISERKQVEQALQESEARFRMMADSAPVLIWMSDTNKLRVFFNKPWLDFTGRTLEEERGFGWTEGVHEQDYQHCIDTYLTGFDAREQFKMEYRLRRFDGVYRWVLSQGVPRFLPDGSPDGSFAGYVGACIDITERKVAEQEREEALAREKEARIEAELASRGKDQFLAVVSHELRSPLNAMLGWAKILKSEKYTEETLKHAVSVIERSARAQQRMVEDLLDSARIISGKLHLDIQPLNLQQLIATVVDAVSPSAEAKKIVLHTFLEGELEIITGDAHRLQQVVMNLLGNAVKFTPEGGHINVSLRRVDSHLRITVSDTGRGISASMLPFVFDSFRQADGSSTRRHSGLGLGLSLSRHLVELHGGTVSVDSPSEEQGATFNINLPVRATRTAIEETEDLITSDDIFKPCTAFNGLRILVVDDEVDAREMITYILEQYGASVTPVASAAEALTQIVNAPIDQCYNLIISDIGMPGEDGYSLIRQVRALSPDQGGQTPAMALTAYGFSSDRIHAIEAGFQAHQAKPVKVMELIMVVARLTGHGITKLK